MTTIYYEYSSRPRVLWSAFLSLLLGVQKYQTVICYSTTNFSKGKHRRDFLVQNCGMILAGAATASLLVPVDGALATTARTGSENAAYDKIMANFGAKTIPWASRSELQPTSDRALAWNQIRYRSSTLVTDAENFAPTPSSTPTFYPDWMEGYWTIQYKFNGASFPQGRKILSLRTAGAGLGTCVSLPNVGYNPPPFAMNFLKQDSDDKIGTLNVYEDLAYNLPRKFEAFWPQSKVLSVQTNGSSNNQEAKLSSSLSKLTPKCFVTGEGCTAKESPRLHLPASRFVFDFEGPTRRSGRLVQASDVSMVDTECASCFGDGTRYAASKTYSQFNINQELQTYYREFVSLESISDIDDTKTVIGKIRVAAFLPKYIRALDTEVSNEIKYDEESAVAIYDYKILMKSLDEQEAATL
jgi:hypothetical protein